MSSLKSVSLLLIIISLLSCEDPSSLIPLSDLPFEYQLELKLKSTSCAFASSTTPSPQILGTMNLGKQDQTVVALIETSRIDLRLEGLKCVDEENQSKALCLATKQSQKLQSIMRSSGVRDESDGLLSCTLTNVTPDTVSPVNDTSEISNDPEWQQALSECCQSNMSNDQAIYLSINDSSVIEGDLSIRHKLIVELPLNGQPNALSSEEYLGAIAACSGPIDCIDRFYLRAQPAQ